MPAPRPRGPFLVPVTAWVRGLATILLWAGPVVGQTARISESVRTLETYPFSEPNPVPILTRDARLYPYHAFDGYAATSEPREWTVVTLENDWIEVYVLPEVGGKVWGAVVKETGHEFIYRNEVLKFRNIALRGPWTSGGIEFNFGVIGHTPATATPVDYVLRDNPDGSVSCIVGAMDLPSRTSWRVEIRLAPDRAAFDTRVLWSNPTPLGQPYYTWMTGAAFARDDLVMTIPGDTYLEHSGRAHPWPVNGDDRDLSVYLENTFDGHKSYHVVGEVADFFGGYYGDAGYGFGHWAPYEDMPGQKLWLWALSREGGIWEDLLTDTDGQYVEFQAGRLLVQFSPDTTVNPITQARFDPMSASRWSESWFPLEALGGLTWASRDGALHVAREGSEATVSVQAFRATSDDLRIWVDGERVATESVSLGPLGVHRTTVPAPPGARIRVALPELRLAWDSDPEDRLLRRPFETDPGAWSAIPEVDRWVMAGREHMRGREYAAARAAFESALGREPWNREALLGSAELEYRSGRNGAALSRVTRVLQLDAYDPEANFLAGLIRQDVGQLADARDAYGWAARSVAFRSAARARMAELALIAGDLPEVGRQAPLSLDFDRHGIPAWRLLAVAARLAGDAVGASAARTELLELDPLHHFARAEAWLEAPSPERLARLMDRVGGEYPGQTLLELAVWYAERGLRDDALRILELHPGGASAPIARAWRAWMGDDASTLDAPGDVLFAFPFRRESLAPLTWAAEASPRWEWRWLLALNLWAVDRRTEALEWLDGLGAEPEVGAVWATRALLASQLREEDPVPGLTRAVALAPETRVFRVLVVQSLLDQGRWEEALEAASQARDPFPEDFNLALLQVRGLLLGDRGDDAVEVLEEVEVLPSEHARESHALWARAHVMVALEQLEEGDARDARESALRAMEWPEHLGQGRPYVPEERLPRFVLARAEAALGNPDRARFELERVAGATPLASADEPAAPLDLLGMQARRELGGEGTPDPALVDAGDPIRDVEARLVERALRLGVGR